MKRIYRLGWVLLIVISCVGCDQATKRIAQEALTAASPITLLNGLVRMEYYENSGAFLGFGATWPSEIRFLLFAVFVSGVLALSAQSRVSQSSRYARFIATMAHSTFVVIRRPGPAWDDSQPMRAQVNWDSHAHFMDDLAASGFILLGGPLTDSRDILLIVEAETEQQVRETLQRDPWEPAGLLITDSVRHWTILLDSRKR